LWYNIVMKNNDIENLLKSLIATQEAVLGNLKAKLADFKEYGITAEVQ